VPGSDLNNQYAINVFSKKFKYFLIDYSLIITHVPISNYEKLLILLKRKSKDEF
jgi:hypothetical protein